MLKKHGVSSFVAGKAPSCKTKKKKKVLEKLSGIYSTSINEAIEFYKRLYNLKISRRRYQEKNFVAEKNKGVDRGVTKGEIFKKGVKGASKLISTGKHRKTSSSTSFDSFSILNLTTNHG